MKKGDVVLIRSSRGEPGVRRIWDPTAEQPQVCPEEYWARWQRNGVEPVCTPVPRDRIFVHEEKLAAELEAASEAAKKGGAGDAANLERLWKQARPAA